MHVPMLASTLTITVSGLVAFVDGPRPGDLTLLLLRNGTLLHRHMRSVERHRPHLVVRTRDACLKPGVATCGGYAAKGGEVFGGVSEQLVRYELSDRVGITGAKPVTAAAYPNWPGTMVSVPDSLCPYSGAAKLHDDLMDDWPTDARVELQGVKHVYPDTRAEHTRHLTFAGVDCPNGSVAIDVHDRWYIEVDITAPAGFAWGDTERRAPLDTHNPTLEVSIWNLPDHTTNRHHKGNDAMSHIAAYYSLLTDKKNCDCILATRGAEPAFCPPAGVGP